MDLPGQKNFYDKRRYFQGKDDPTDPQPDGEAKQPLPLGQLVFGILFLAFVAALAWLRIRDEAPRPTEIPTPPAPTAKSK